MCFPKHKNPRTREIAATCRDIPGEGLSRGTIYRAPTIGTLTSHGLLVAARPREGVDERAGTRRVIPYLKRGVEVEDVAGRKPAARAVNRKHRVAIDFVEVDVLEHGASPVREVEKIHARLVGVDAGLDGDPAHRLSSAEEQIEIIAAALAAFLDDLADGDAQIFPGVLLFHGHVRNELAEMIDAQRFAHQIGR